MKIFEVYVSGSVQGVFYRAFVVNIAQELAISGYCENLTDGRVHIVFRADMVVKEQFVERLWSGPVGARVDDIEISEIADPGLPVGGFTIKRDEI